MSTLLDRVVGWWAEPRDNVEGKFDLIAPLSYGTRRGNLARATAENTRVASRLLLRQSPGAYIAFGNTGYIFPGAATYEAREKRQILLRSIPPIPEEKIIDVGVINSTIHEAHVISLELGRRRLLPRQILLATGEMHAPAARLIWKVFFPEAEIRVAVNHYSCETEPGHPVFVQRSPWLWLFYQMARQVALRVLKPGGQRTLQLFEGFHHAART